MPPDSGIRDDSSDRPFARPRGNCSAILDRGRPFCAGWRRSSLSSQSSMEIKRATASDSARIAQLLIDVRKRFMPYAPSPHSDAQIRSWVAQFLVPSGGVVLALEGDAMLGATATAQESDRSWITQMAVDPAHVGHGVGSSLLAYALDILPPPVFLYTFQANTRARRFYERHGFRAKTFSDGLANDERCPDVLYEFVPSVPPAGG